MSGIFKKISKNNFFPIAEISGSEFKKLGLLRIIFSLFLILRSVEITYCFYLLGENTAIFLGIAYLACSIFMGAGLLLPITLPIIALLSVPLDIYYHTATLGTSLVVLLSWLLFFSSHFEGQLSLDALILKRFKGLRKLYRFSVADSSSELTKLYFFFFILYGSLSLGALFFHLDDPTWRSLMTGKALFQNSFLCEQYVFFRKVELFFSFDFMKIQSQVGIGFQTIFQAFMIPLMFTRIGKNFVVVWGAIFFTVSLFFIQLGSLPHYEIIFWTVLFYRSKSSQEIKVIDNKSRTLWKIFRISYVPILCVFFLQDIAPKKYEKPLSFFLMQFGLLRPDVFNYTDLKMGDRWPVFYRETQEGLELVPIIGLDGERLNYWFGRDVFFFQNHGSDFLYFANTLPYRRKLINQCSEPAMRQKQKCLQYLKKIARLDYKNTKITKKYVVVIYENKSSELNLSVQERFRSKESFRVKFKIH